MKLTDIYEKEKYIRVTGKGNKERLVPIGNIALKQINSYMKERANLKIDPSSKNILFLNNRGKGISRVMVFLIIKKLVKEAGIDKTISPHTLLSRSTAIFQYTCVILQVELYNYTDTVFNIRMDPRSLPGMTKQAKGIAMFIKRDLEPALKRYASKFPVVAVIGPRQAGKTTLTKEVFPTHKYFSFEDPDTLEIVRADPRDFLEKNYGTPGIILDEFQNEPQILSYIQGIVDREEMKQYEIY